MRKNVSLVVLGVDLLCVFMTSWRRHKNRLRSSICTMPFSPNGFTFASTALLICFPFVHIVAEAQYATWSTGCSAAVNCDTCSSTVTLPSSTACVADPTSGGGGGGGVP